MFHRRAPCGTAWLRGCPLTMCIVYWNTTHSLRAIGTKASSSLPKCLEDFRPSLCTVVDGEDHDAVLIDGVGCDKGRIRNDQLTSSGNLA